MTKALLFFFLLTVTNLMAQLQRGDQLITFGNSASLQLGVNQQALTGDLLTLGGTNRSKNMQLYTLPNYSFMVSDRVMVGMAFTGISVATEANIKAFAVNPNVRAYLTNEASGGVYGGLGYVILSSNRFGGQNVSAAYPHVGASFRLTPNLLFGPEVGVLVYKQAPNQVSAALQFEVLLDQQQPGGDPFMSRLARGSFLLGTTGVGYTNVGRSETTAFAIRPQVHYLFTGSTAIGLRAASYAQSYVDPGVGRGPIREEQKTASVGLSLRQFVPTHRRVVPFVEVGYNTNSVTVDDEQTRRTQGEALRGSYASRDVALGTLLFVRPTIALEAGVGHTRSGAASDERLLTAHRTTSLLLGGRIVLGKG